MKKEEISKEKKREIVGMYLNAHRTITSISQEYKVSRARISDWLFRYKTQGEAGLEAQQGSLYYTAEEKERAVKDYVLNKLSVDETCKKYGILSKSTFAHWVSRYNKSRESVLMGGSGEMIKGKKNQLERKAEIVRFCIANRGNYYEAASYFETTPAKIAEIVEKHAALSDTKQKDMQLLRAQNHILQERNKKLEMELDVLKKLDEKERGCGTTR